MIIQSSPCTPKFIEFIHHFSILDHENTIIPNIWEGLISCVVLMPKKSNKHSNGCKMNFRHSELVI
jgi:hypothetical protein